MSCSKFFFKTSIKGISCKESRRLLDFTIQLWVINLPFLQISIWLSHFQNSISEKCLSFYHLFKNILTPIPKNRYHKASHTSCHLQTSHHQAIMPGITLHGLSLIFHCKLRFWKSLQLYIFQSHRFSCWYFDHIGTWHHCGHGKESRSWLYHIMKTA